MSERNEAATFQGNPLTLVEKEIKVGDKAPDFTVLQNDLSPATLSDYDGKVLILALVPSLDTPVCDMEVRRFNNEAAALGDDIRILTVSMDLPFAQARWCGAAGVEAVQTLSDHRNASLGEGYGALIKELRLLTRAVFVIDRDRTIKHAEYVKEITEEPDYAAALDAAKAALS
ncbi:MAG: thiol peroxidase [Thermodesulfobacteriota bacterium]|nr:thiol peroxidase [Thermodesulfobacteriota bacterium]